MSVAALVRVYRGRLLAATVLTAVTSLSVLVMSDTARGVQVGPAGNNGTIKVDGNDIGGIGNDPHIVCPFSIDWYGFDEGNQAAVVSFEAQPPAASFTPVAALSGATSFTFVGSGAGNTLDHHETYTLDVTGLFLQPNQGYHVKVTVSVTGAQGNDTKDKVFWVDPCTTGSPSPSPSVSVSASVSVSPSVSVSASVSVSPSVSVSASVSVSPSPSHSFHLDTPTPSVSPSVEPSPTPTVEQSPSDSASPPAPTPSESPEVLGEQTQSPAPSPSESATVLGVKIVRNPAPQLPNTGAPIALLSLLGAVAVATGLVVQTSSLRVARRRH